MAKTDIEVAKDQVPAAAFDYGDMAHEGFEDTSLGDLSIPFINVLQSLSPEITDETVPGAKVGDLLNSVTKEILKQPLIVIPVEKEEAWVEWVPRTQGGGLVGRHSPDSELVQSVIKKNGGSRLPPKDAEGKRIAFKTPSGNDLIETHYVYCLIMNDEGTAIESYCVLSFASAKIKTHKDWMTALYTQKGRPPIFANRAKISTQKVKNEKGTFFIYAVAPLKDTWRESLITPNEAGMALLNEARDFRKMIQDGLAKPDYSSMTGEDSEQGSTSGHSRPANMDDDEAPF